ncbi:putative DnaJ chaperone protein [Trypanosoma theileri]|uniref:Putative DnaJ chaperone protein n=1 Tax=Trypanosoma theileri TaxID=67003 RepID=A0A1X0P8S0_9TRYP|nr:putative DnaJ chaperone protein [Trypanosoma theileri]ORC93322.1 putative DnaJ chaperone protein [Trypanosoma theileri]
MDYYEILEVSRDATPEQIRSSYHRLALRYHPDKAGPEGAERFKEIHEAYEVLSSPEKRQMYDMYGNVAGDELTQMFGNTSPFIGLLVLLFFALLIVILCIIFSAFIAAYVDGRLRSRDVSTVDDHSRAYWNYVKVFSPIFIIDILIGIPALWMFLFSLCACSRVLFLNSAITLCCIVLSIIIPVVKDANDMKTLRGETDFRLWHVWLVPMYIAMILFVIRCVVAFPSKALYERLVSRQMEWLWKCVKIEYVFSILRCLPMMVFCALIACRADDVITTNYFVVVGMPFFVWAFLVVVDAAICKILLYKRKEIVSTITLSASILMLFLLITVGLVSKRLNDVSRVHSGGGGSVLSLGRALIPVYIFLGLLFLVIFIMIFQIISLYLLYISSVADPNPDGAPEAEDTHSNSAMRQDGEETQDEAHNRSQHDNNDISDVHHDSETVPLIEDNHNNEANYNSVDEQGAERSGQPSREQEGRPVTPQRRLSDID